MKRGLLFLVLIAAFSGCKVREKKPAAAVVKEEAPRNVEKPIVNSVAGKYNFVDSTSARVFIKTHITLLGEKMSMEKLNESFRVQWALQTDFGIREKISTGKLAFTPEFARPSGDSYLLSFDIPRIKEYTGGILLVEFIHPASGTKFSYDMAVDFTAKRSNTRYEIYKSLSYEVPDFQSYIYSGESFVIKSLKPSAEPLFLIRYRNNAKPALSPMSGTKRAAESEFEIAETLEIKDRVPLTLAETGMYVLTQNPEDVKDGYGFLVVDKRYPRDTRPETLKEALVYMSTSKEIESSATYDSGKDAMDMYFLNLAKGDQELARKIIRSYYKRIEEANEFFTTYKEGWKTDKGMVYVIMGPPARVQRNRTREVWLYSQSRNTSEIIYTFYKKPNVFSEQNYELVRYPEYSAFWYPYVESWRTGKAAE
ncbi:MAG: GWxTD domain-containing protein [Leadbetterella sp.]|nr:GWxTD domain-containing protein [Leadbetterella sp.]